ncbi:hypothetical protein GCM10010339_92190 [Streptomyces alanosinicus]|uniref:Uncharacterized protein n=1 Tax=Streptomyces alanosinicus TaxID=68171 RepID=A0A918YUN4_9ACTN|nr:hypothetical protein GCM10010339_92190 [Streptomyces alanosinicus]
MPAISYFEGIGGIGGGFPDRLGEGGRPVPAEISAPGCSVRPAAGLLTAIRAPAWAGRRHRLHHQDAGGVAHSLHPHIDPGKQHILNPLARHGRKYAAETIPLSGR